MKCRKDKEVNNAYLLQFNTRKKLKSEILVRVGVLLPGKYRKGLQEKRSTAAILRHNLGKNQFILLTALSYSKWHEGQRRINAAGKVRSGNTALFAMLPGASCLSVSTVNF